MVCFGVNSSVMKHVPILKCLACQRPLQNRLVDQCLYCGAPVPAHLQLTEEEKSVIREEQSAQLERDHLAREQRKVEEKEKRERFQGDADDSWGIFPFLF